MSRFLKIILISLLSLASFLVLGSGIISYFFQDETIRFVVETINKHVTSRIEVQSAHFSVVRKFPHAAVEFKRVVMSPAKDFDTLSFDPVQSRHLLTAESVFAEMNLFRMLTGDYRITRIEVRDGNIHLLTDQNGKHNFIFWKTSEETTGDTQPIELQNVTLRNVDVYYGHRKSATAFALHAGFAQISGRFSSQQHTVTTDWQGAVRLFSVDDDVFIRDKTLELSGKLDADNNTFTIRRSELTLAKVGVSVSGGFSAGDEVHLDLRVEGQQLDYASLVSALPDTYRQKMNDYPGKGNVNFTASISGKAGGGSIPHVEAQFGMTQGQITHRQSKVRLTNLTFTGTFTTGAQNRQTTTALHIRDFGCSMDNGTLKGSLSLQNFSRPQITAKIAGTNDLEQLYRFIPANQIASISGQMNCDVTVKTRLKKLSLTKADDMEQLELQGTVVFNDVSMRLREPAYRFSSINGTLMLDNRMTTNNLSLMHNGNDYTIDGYMERWVPFMLNRSKTLYLKANVTSQHLCVDSLLTSDNKATPVVANKSQERAALLLPENIEFDANLEAIKFSYQKFEAERMNARLAYRPRVLDIPSITFSTMTGNITGRGSVANNKANHLQVFGETALRQVDVKQLFRSFDNFGQNKLRYEHVNGKLSGDLGFVIGWDHRMQLQQDEIAVEGRMDLDGGELVNFEPLNNLSRFVALEELQNIRFSKLRTQVSIKDKKLTFPQTDVQTSAFDIICSGEQHFDQSYTYRVKILLSELLAAKARRAKRENRENEYEEDGGKRTALYLKITGQGENFEFSYDQQAAKASVAEDIRNERQTLRSILNEEFGWFKKDTTLVKPTAPDDTGKLRFTFDDE